MWGRVWIEKNVLLRVTGWKISPHFFIVKIILSYVQFLCWVNESITFYRWNIQLQNIKKFPHLKIIKSTFVQKEKISFAQIFIKEDVIIRYKNKENVYF